MRIVRYNENMLDECAEFWWSIYKDMPYVHRPDGYQTINTPPIGPNPEYFVKYLKSGLSTDYMGSPLGAKHWGGEVTDDSIVLAVDEGRVSGILVNSIDREKLTGNILSAYVQRDNRGREIADCLLSEALERFRKMGLHRVVAAPDQTKTLEVECPMHLALLDAGFAWENDWEPGYPMHEYCVLLGGSYEDFRLQPEIKQKIEWLDEEGIPIERVTADGFDNLRRFDTGEKPTLSDDVTFVALYWGDTVVGWLPELRTREDEFGRILGGAVPEVIPKFRRRGIGKALYHLGIEEAVRQGAQYGYTGTNIHNPAHLLYRSIGYRYWYTSFNMVSKRLR
ncbi:GNAT family N-acetyltransferase [bacterium]|nr:GNAT family N-acetyltransferase [bacterium]